MQTCALCQNPTAPRDPFCSICGHARIVESLRASTDRPPWSERALVAGAAIIGIWLIITLGVAFLREAKAVRRAREALALDNVDLAYHWISPFVPTHQDHIEALFIAGVAAMKTSRPEEAQAHYFKLGAMTEEEDAVERKRQLEEVYHDQIPKNAALLECGQSPYEQFYESYNALGDQFRNTIVRSGAAVARKCVGSRQRGMANEPGYWLINAKGIDPELVVRSLYLEPIKPALERGQYLLAANLALQGLGLWPEARTTIDELFSDIREQTGQAVVGLQDLCSKVNSEYHQGRSSCFPETAPDLVTTFRDAWGNPVYYAPLHQWRECYSGFQLVSLGADAKPSPNDTETAATDIICSYQWDRRQWRGPDRFWLPPQ